MRRTKIINTIGPKTESKEMIKKMVDAGMNIARINMSHGNPKWVTQIAKRVKQVGSTSRFPVGLMIDTQGPEIRTSLNGEIGLEEGERFKIAVSSACDILEGEKYSHVNHPKIAKDLKKGDTILIDDGLIALKAVSVEPHCIDCVVLNKGTVKNKKSVNLPGIKIDLPSVTEKDIKDITLGAKLGMDYVAQSFVRSAKDVKVMRKHLKKLKSDALILAKIEDQEGVNNIDEIIAESDGVMVARGDLGVEVPFEEIPLIQRKIARKCVEAGKIVIIATHLIESMIDNPRPTRAEVTDVANAVFERSDCVMTSGETTKGSYPIQCVKTMNNIAETVEKRLRFKVDSDLKTNDVKEAMTLGACINADNVDAKAIIVFSKTGKLLKLVTKNSPNIDVFVFTEDDHVKRQLMMYWATFPFKLKFEPHIEKMVQKALTILKKNKYLKKGDRIVVVSDVQKISGVDTVEIREV